MKLGSLILVGVLAACAYGDPHQNFLEYQARKIGGSIDDLAARRALVDDSQLQNGNRVAKYWYVQPYKNRQCIEIYEYDPIARKILKASFEGNQCIWNP
ncbi:hypothetical protein [Limnohabitans sp. 2KL-1]|uniref:hypothetical protein n=1 Tax=Limnohabitans sp. 2KL-1 TaxID=1100699 RepID=UPI0011B25C07|nr:hypothetical protein [Limnohabitans sp. 2KL-1]